MKDFRARQGLRKQVAQVASKSQTTY